MIPDLQYRRHPLFPEDLEDAVGVGGIRPEASRWINLYGDDAFGCGELRRLRFGGQRFPHELNPCFDGDC